MLYWTSGILRVGSGYGILRVYFGVYFGYTSGYTSGRGIVGTLSRGKKERRPKNTPDGLGVIFWNNISRIRREIRLVAFVDFERPLLAPQPTDLDDKKRGLFLEFRSTRCSHQDVNPGTLF